MNHVTTKNTSAACCNETRTVDRLFEDLFDGFFTRPTGTWMPVADVTEASDHVHLQLDLPGVRREDVEIVFENGQLVISGTRPEPTTEDGHEKVRRERHWGSFTRRFALGKRFNSENVHAELRDGVLSLRIPKAEAAVAKRIEIA